MIYRLTFIRYYETDLSVRTLDMRFLSLISLPLALHQDDLAV